MLLFKYSFIKYGFIKPFIFNTSRGMLPRVSPGPHQGCHEQPPSVQERLWVRRSLRGLVQETAGGCA